MCCLYLKLQAEYALYDLLNDSLVLDKIILSFLLLLLINYLQNVDK